MTRQDVQRDLGQALFTRRACKLIQAPRTLTLTELIELLRYLQHRRILLTDLLRCMRHDVVHVSAPHEDLAPPRHWIPFVGCAQTPSFHDILNQRAIVRDPLHASALGVGKFEQYARRFLYFRDGVEHVKRRNVAR